MEHFCPRGFPQNLPTDFPVDYESNFKAWMTGEVLTHYLKKWDTVRAKTFSKKEKIVIPYFFENKRGPL